MIYLNYFSITITIADPKFSWKMFSLFVIISTLALIYCYYRVLKSDVSQLYDNGILWVRDIGEGIFIPYSSIYKVEESYKKSGSYTIHKIQIYSKQFPDKNIELRDLCKDFPDCILNQKMLEEISRKDNDIEWIEKEWTTNK